MKDKLGIILMEEADGKIAVQLFTDPVAIKDSFDNMKGKPGQNPQRVTLIHLEYAEGKVKEVKAWAKDLPVLPVPVEEMPDAWKLGEGPVKIGETKV